MPRTHIVPFTVIIVAALLLLPAAGQSNESLGDVARRIRAEKNKAAQTAPQPAPVAAPDAASSPLADIKIAEGAYGSFNSWTLWQGLGSTLRADIDMHVYTELARAKGKAIQQKETLAMDTEFMLRGFRYESKNFGGLPDGALECTKNPESLDCVSTFQGQSGKGQINARGGYTTQFGVHVALLDLPWFYTTLVAESDRDIKQPRTFGIVTIAFDGQTPDTLITGQGADAEVKYIGRETIEVLGHQVKAHKLRIDARHYPATVWIAESGLLLAADWADMHIALTRFRQWVKLVPDLPVEPLEPASKP